MSPGLLTLGCTSGGPRSVYSGCTSPYGYRRGTVPHGHISVHIRQSGTVGQDPRRAAVWSVPMRNNGQFYPNCTDWYSLARIPRSTAGSVPVPVDVRRASCRWTKDDPRRDSRQEPRMTHGGTAGTSRSRGAGSPRLRLRLWRRGCRVAKDQVIPMALGHG